MAGQKKGAKKAEKKAGKLQDSKEDKPPAPEPGEEANVALQENIPEPEHNYIDKTEKNVNLKISAVADFANYSVDIREIFFRPTLMYESRTHTL